MCYLYKMTVVMIVVIILSKRGLRTLLGRAAHGILYIGRYIYRTPNIVEDIIHWER